jgi:alkylation response protein AidB-like acyl-CoA dehydrogenase
MLSRPLFSEDHSMFRESVSQFLEKEAVPFHEQWEKDKMVPRDLWLKAGENGFLCPTIPEEYGGVGVDYRFNAIVVEEIWKKALSGVGFSLHSDIVVPYLEHQGSPEQKEKYFPRMISGEIITAIAMTEPNAGSDLQGIKTSAIKDGDGYILNGSKTFITNGYNCDMAVVAAKTDPNLGAKGTSLFLVDADLAGFTKGKPFDKAGLKAQDTCELFFDNVKLPKDALLGEEGKGFIYMMQELPQERLSVAISGVAAAEAAIDWTIAYTKERKAFGKTIFDKQNTRFKLAECVADTQAVRCFVDHCLELHIEGKLDAVTAAMAKLKATDLQFAVLDECVQLHGGYGYMWEYPVCRAWADGRVQKIYAGTNEIMKEIVARSL